MIIPFFFFFKSDPEISTISKKAKVFITELKNIGTSLNINEKHQNLLKTKSIDEIKAESPKGKLDKFKLQEALLEQVKEKKSKSMNAFERLREEIVRFCHTTFTTHLDDMPLRWHHNEIFYFDDTSIVKKMLLGAPRSAMQSALALPFQYIKDPELANITVDQIPDVLPDISIAYKLHLECGKLINLYDWLQVRMSVFNVIIRAEQSKAEGFVERSEVKIFQVAIWTYEQGAFFGAKWGPKVVIFNLPN